MSKITKKEERLARALVAISSTLGVDIATDRAHIYWPEKLEEAREIIAAQNLLVWYEDYHRPLHGSVAECHKSLAVYNDNFTGGAEGHDSAFEAVLEEARCR